MLTRPRIRQLGLGELLDETFRLYRSNFLTFVAIAALVLVPYTIISFIGQYPVQDRLNNLQTNNNALLLGQQALFDMLAELLFLYVVLIGVSLLYTVVFQPLLEGALAHAIAQRHLGRETSVGDSFGTAVRHSPALIGARLIPVLIGILIFGTIFGGSLLIVALIAGLSFDQIDSSSFGLLFGLGMLGIGLFILMTLFALALMVRILFTSQAIIVEKAGAWESLVRSWRLTEGSFWRILGYLFVIFLLIYILIALPSFVINSAVALMVPDLRVQFAINTCVSAVLSVIITPFSMITYTLLYFDLRVRKEGFDLEYQASALMPSAAGISSLESR